MLGHGNSSLSPAPCTSPALFLPHWSQQVTPYGSRVSPYNPSEPADIVVQVTGRQFYAHRSVLAAHSDYFKCILADYSAAASLHPSPSPASQKLPELLFLTLSIPSVSSKLFAVLLDYMYSSRLGLDTHSVTDVLFGAQLLRMQHAIDACHSHLLQLQQRLFSYQSLGVYPAPLLQSMSPDRLLPSVGHHHPIHAGIVRPIPTTGTPAYFSTYSSHQRHSFGARFPPWSSMAEALRSAPCHGTGCNPAVAVPTFPPLAESASERDPFITVRAIHCHSSDMPLNTTANQSNGQGERESPAPSSSTLCSSGSVHGQSSTASTPCPQFNQSDADDGNEEASGVDKGTDNRQQKSVTTSVKAVIDIACCDGPVKFQRVLNENCSLVIMMTATTQEPVPRSRPGDTAQWSKEGDQTSDGYVPGKSFEARAASTLGSSSVSCCQTKSEEAKNSSLPSRSAPTSPTASYQEKKSGSSGLLYHCVHCKHSFKSRCCYMKHRWRHLNPLTLDSQFRRRRRVPHREAQPETSNQADRISSTDSGDSRKPLEINVPFYPCKVCGCKFPSYYFVHKHRRMCHQKRRPGREEDQKGVDDGDGEDSSSVTISDGEDGNANTTDTCADDRENLHGVE